jgi:hypothetical protein
MKKSLLSLAFLLIAIFTFAQKLDSTALILIDIQDFYFPGGKVELVEPEKASNKPKQYSIIFVKTMVWWFMFDTIFNPVAISTN